MKLLKFGTEFELILLLTCQKITSVTTVQGYICEKNCCAFDKLKMHLHMNQYCSFFSFIV